MCKRFKLKEERHDTQLFQKHSDLHKDACLSPPFLKLDFPVLLIINDRGIKVYVTKI